MKIKDLVLDSDWNEIEKILLTLDKNKDNLEGYKKVYEDLLNLKPKKSDCILKIKHVKNDEEEYEDVFGTSKNDNQDYALEFTSWQEWLDMEIDTKTQKKYSKPSIIANCIYEMTFFGFNQKKIKKKMDELLKLRTDESKRIPLEDLRKELEKP
jgi:hypothetical protein